MDFNSISKEFKQHKGVAPPEGTGSRPPNVPPQGGDLCPPGEKWCVIEFPKWGGDARILYCRHAGDRFTAKRHHRGLPVFLRVELATLARAVAGQGDDEADALFRRVYQMKRAAMKTFAQDLWVTGIEGDEVTSQPEAPADLTAEMREYTTAVQRLGKALEWFGNGQAKDPAQEKQAQEAFKALLSKVEALTAKMLDSGREMTREEILEGFTA